MAYVFEPVLRFSPFLANCFPGLRPRSEKIGAYKERCTSGFIFLEPGRAENCVLRARIQSGYEFDLHS